MRTPVPDIIMGPMHLRIEASDLPGRQCPAPDGTYRNIHVAVQRRNRPGDLLDPQPGDAASAAWTLECAVAGTDITGPHVQGGPGARFVYLSWGEIDAAGTFGMFRRAKLLLDAVPVDVLTAAADTGLLVARLGLTDAHGMPRCARVVPPVVTWAAAP